MNVTPEQLAQNANLAQKGGHIGTRLSDTIPAYAEGGLYNSPIVKKYGVGLQNGGMGSSVNNSNVVNNSNATNALILFLYFLDMLLYRNNIKLSLKYSYNLAILKSLSIIYSFLLSDLESDNQSSIISSLSHSRISIIF